MERRVLFLQPDRLVCYCHGADRNTENSIDRKQAEKRAGNPVGNEINKESQPGHIHDSRYSITAQWTICGDKLPDNFRTYVKEHVYAEYSLVFDLPEEECHQDNLKAAGFGDRRHIIERQRKKRFESALLSKVSVAGPRGNAKVLMSGIDHNCLCENLILELASVGISVKSIHSTTTLAPQIAGRGSSKLPLLNWAPVIRTPGKQDLVKPALVKQVLGKHDLANHDRVDHDRIEQDRVDQVKSKDAAQLFVIPLRGFCRLVACSGKSLLFTRRISVSRLDVHADVHDYRELCQSISETVLYLQRLQGVYLPAVLVIGPASVADKLRLLCSDIPASVVSEVKHYWPSPCEVLDPTAVEQIFVESVNGAGRGYAQVKHQLAYVSRKVRNTAAAIAVCSLFAVFTSAALANKLNRAQAVVVDSYSQSAARLRSDIAQLESSYDQPVEAVRQALVAARLLELGSREPLQYLQQLAQSVHAQPDISISSVLWESDEIINDGLLSNQLTQPKPLESIPLEQIYRVTLAGVVEGSPGFALDQFESFVAALRVASMNPSVVVVETPFGPGEEHRSGGVQAGRGEFVLEISNQKVER